MYDATAYLAVYALKREEMTNDFTIEIAVAISVFLVLTVVVLWFQLLKTWDKKKGESRLAMLAHSIELNQSQIKRRNSYLSRYKFSAYNLSEALIIQSEIDI